MSFKCEKCSKVAPKGVSPVMEVVETRSATYPVRYKDPEHPRQSEVIDKGGKGAEIAKEIKVCPECAKK
jgi:hypothetical protein